MINYKDYHPRWSLISRVIREKRAGNRCEWCSAENGKPHPDTSSRVMLTVAHLDQDRTNNRFWNLAALCQRCHLNHDRKQHIYSRRYGRQTKYVCGRFFPLPSPQRTLPKLFAVPAHSIRMHYSKKKIESTLKLFSESILQLMEKKK